MGEGRGGEPFFGKAPSQGTCHGYKVPNLIYTFPEWRKLDSEQGYPQPLTLWLLRKLPRVMVLQPLSDAGSGQQHPIALHSWLVWSPATTLGSDPDAATPLLCTTGMGNATFQPRQKAVLKNLEDFKSLRDFLRTIYLPFMVLMGLGYLSEFLKLSTTLLFSIFWTRQNFIQLNFCCKSQSTHPFTYPYKYLFCSNECQAWKTE